MLYGSARADAKSAFTFHGLTLEATTEVLVSELRVFAECQAKYQARKHLVEVLYPAFKAKTWLAVYVF